MIKCVATKIFLLTLKFIVNPVHTMQMGQRISFEKAWWGWGCWRIQRHSVHWFPGVEGVPAGSWCE